MSEQFVNAGMKSVWITRRKLQYGVILCFYRALQLADLATEPYGHCRSGLPDIPSYNACMAKKPEGFVARIKGLGSFTGSGYVGAVVAGVVVIVVVAVWHSHSLQQKIGGDGVNVGGDVHGNVDVSQHSADNRSQNPTTNQSK